MKSYDYSSAGYYFVTICVKDGHEMLWSKPVGANCVRPGIHPRLSEYGNIVEKEISVLSKTYDAVKVVKHVVMPNHVRMIVVIGDSGRTQFAPTISRAIKQFKGSVTNQIGFSLWQKSYHDHIIRSAAQYRRIWQYIDTNPATWPQDCYYTNKHFLHSH